jgi:energy-converting hydrogenase Eha subunit E
MLPDSLNTELPCALLALTVLAFPAALAALLFSQVFA